MIGLRRRADLNDCFGLVQAKHGADLFSVRLGHETILCKHANLVFVGHMSAYIRLEECHEKDVRKHALVLDEEMRAKYVCEKK